MAGIFDHETEQATDAAAQEADSQSADLIQQAVQTMQAVQASLPRDQGMGVFAYGAPSAPGWPAAPQPFVPATPVQPIPVPSLWMDPPPPHADAEFAALGKILDALAGLPPEAQKRLVRYLASRYEP